MHRQKGSGSSILRMSVKRDSGAEIDDLYRQPLADFTAARNALSARLRREGRALEAERVKTLAKPTAPAWAVNQLYWESPKRFDQLHAATGRVRKAQTGLTKNADLGALLDAKKQLLAELVERAAAILTGGGHAASPEALRRVSATLESLAVWGTTEGAPQAGRLSSDLDPPGFDALAALMDGTAVASAKVLLFRPPKPAEDPTAARERARAALQAAEKTLREARREAVRAETGAAKADARTAALEKQRQEIEARYAEAKEQSRNAANQVKKAAQAVAEAERLLARAKAAIE